VPVPGEAAQLPSGNGGIAILPAHADPEVFKRILADPAFAAIETNPHTGAFGRAYHPAIHGNRDCSFSVVAKDAPALLCLCAPLDNKLGFYGLPLRLIARKDLDDDTRRAAINAAFQHLDDLMETHHLREMVLLDDGEPGASHVAVVCHARAGTMSLRPVALVDLTVGLAGWRAALRKSSRSLINWGRRNLSISYVNKDAPDRVLFEKYRAFHAEVAGRITRAEGSWVVMYDWIVRGGGELVMAFLGERLVASSMFIDGTEISIYASGVYDRTQFDKPLAHYPVWLGIERAQMRGMKWVDLGEVPPHGTVPDKEYQIGYFKRGFATNIKDTLVWRLASPSHVAV
jgi:hypothetical protein